MARYLITGGAGFIGSHICQALVARDDDVVVLDNFSTGKRPNLEPMLRDIELIEGDIRDKETVVRAMNGVDYVIHQAALASVQRSVEDPTPTNEVNVQGTLNLLEAAADGGVKRFVYASSSSVYGDSEELPKHEGMVPNPMSPYAASKLAGEWYCRIFSGLRALPTTGLRYFNVFGPRQDPSSQYAAVIPIFVTSLLSGEQATIFGDGEQSRDFTFIDNVVNANLAACAAKGSGGDVYNVACGDRFTLNVLYDRLQNTLGVDLSPIYAEPRAGDVRHSMASIDSIRDALGYEVAVAFEDGLERTVNWYKEAEAASR